MKYRILYLAILAVLATAWSSNRVDAGPATPMTFTVDSLDDISTSCSVPGSCTLRSAINEAELNPGPDTIVFDPALTSGGPATINLSNGQLPVIGQPLTITGPGSAMLTIDAMTSAGKQNRVFSIDAETTAFTVNISGLTATGGYLDGNHGGAIYLGQQHILNLTDVAITNSVVADAYGGGIFVYHGELNLTDSMIIGNEALDDGDYGYGGGIGSYGTVNLSNTEISANHADDDGGGIYLSSSTGGTAMLTGAMLLSNSAYERGGGIYVSTTGAVMLSGTRVNSNLSESAGGGIYGSLGGAADIEESSLSHNDSGSDGGGLFAYLTTTGATLDIVDSNVVDNESYNAGGGLYMSGSAPSVLFTVQGSRVDDNESTNSNGGGIYFSGNRLDVTGSSVSDNIADGTGGGVYIGGIYGNDKSVEITGSTIAGNEAGNNGGGLYAYASSSATAMLLNTTVSGNTAANSGGGLYLSSSGGSMSITHGTITNNIADNDHEDDANGGGLYVLSDAPTITNTIIAGNDDASDVAVPGSVKGDTLHDDCSGSITTAGVNLIGDTTGCAGTFTNDLVGTEYDAGLLELTQVPGLPISIHDLGLASDAINAADPATCADEDAIGQTRNADACDIGAVESISLAIYLYNEANGGCTIGTGDGGVASSMSLLLLAVGAAFAFERRRRRS